MCRYYNIRLHFFYRLCVSFVRLSEYVIGILCNGDEVYYVLFT